MQWLRDCQAAPNTARAARDFSGFFSSSIGWRVYWTAGPYLRVTLFYGLMANYSDIKPKRIQTCENYRFTLYIVNNSYSVFWITGKHNNPWTCFLILDMLFKKRYKKSKQREKLYICTIEASTLINSAFFMQPKSIQNK